MLEYLPTLNALLNATSGILLVIAHHFIKQGERERHRRLMIAAFTVSVFFLASYLTYHWFHGTTRFAGEGWVRPLYFTVLVSHTILAACVAPLAVISLRLGLKGKFATHAKVAKWTYPIWVYVSVTGVVVYVMLYRIGW